ncbi:ACT domain-containing protein [Endozoicomonas ascidiicola]|uniref:ACT domain-containing protein n=1 Tax=Endozoicomonas ascidiicola TaxID=1698521 RepID=UPI00082C593A|nr:ACT domain-containing protein [Endozoicomonas ascidiicola]
MSGIIELEALLRSMEPKLVDEEFVFCTFPGQLQDYLHLQPIATFLESEGLSLIITRTMADTFKVGYSSVFKQITLTVHSSLDAVGLTAAISNKLASKGISANVVAAYYHDHIFIQSDKADIALAALKELTAQ